MTLSELNTADLHQFIDAVGWVFEDSPWIAERTWPRRPFASLDGLHHALEREAFHATQAEQLELLRAHPDLGTRARMTPSSSSEQTGAGLDRLSQAQFERLQHLTTAYREKFGFPFLFAVKGSTIDQILEALEQRLTRSRDEEFGEAMRQASRIARFRLESSLHVE
jgi:2-oxo-4-hydroxy-4-carboxy-5-ureidoimidazoline decarboxylase